MLAPLATLPDSSRIWIFAADRKLSAAESTELLAALDAYLATWKAHGAPVQAGRELHYDQFLLIAADPQITAPSGCSIDDMTRTMKSLGTKFGVDFFTTMKVFYREGNKVRMTDRAGFKALAASGVIDESTITFDNSLTNLTDFRAGKWELPVSASWQRALLPLLVV